jgi:hypothetical protein
VAYYRVSTDRQGRSGLGLDAQRKAVMDYLNGGAWELIGEFTEVESGKHSDRPELAKALASCRKQRARLVIARLDRLSRNLAFIATLMESGVEFVAVDNPTANKLTVHILAAVAQHEREPIAPVLFGMRPVAQADRKVRARSQHDEMEGAAQRRLPQAGRAANARSLRPDLPRSAEGAVARQSLTPSTKDAAVGWK